jgi:hypothetical protein
VRWYREIALFVPWFIAQVRILLPSGTPGCLNRVYVVKATMLILIKPDVIKDEKLHFGIPVTGISDACGAEVFLGLLGNISGVSSVRLFG